jgi:hypothetical protein
MLGYVCKGWAQIFLALALRPLRSVVLWEGVQIYHLKLNATIKRENFALWFLTCVLRNHISVASYMKFPVSNRLRTVMI